MGSKDYYLHVTLPLSSFGSCWKCWYFPMTRYVRRSVSCWSGLQYVIISSFTSHAPIRTLVYISIILGRGRSGQAAGEHWYQPRFHHRGPPTVLQRVPGHSICRGKMPYISSYYIEAFLYKSLCALCSFSAIVFWIVLYRVFIKYCAFFEDFKIFSESGLSRFPLGGVSVCTQCNGRSNTSPAPELSDFKKNITTF